MRDRLVDLINEAKDEYPSIPSVNCCKPTFVYYLADRLLANGGILPLCKVGDEVWFISCLDEIVYIGTIHDVRYNGCSCIYRIVRSVENGGVFAFSDYEIGKSVFLARKEAEQSLKGEHHAEIH